MNADTPAERRIMRWKLDELLAAADAIEVAEHIGLRTKKRGKTLYCECPTGHKESQLNHCQLFHDGCHCYSCGAHLSIYDMVKEFFANVNGANLTHDEICTFIADTCGGADLYVEKPVKGKKKEIPFPLTDEELTFIGLKPKRKRIKTILAFSEEKTDECQEFDIKAGGYVKYGFNQSPSIYALFRENPEAFWTIVRNKYNEAIKFYSDSFKIYSKGLKNNPTDHTAKAWRDETVEKYAIILPIREKILKNKKYLKES